MTVKQASLTGESYSTEPECTRAGCERVAVWSALLRYGAVESRSWLCSECMDHPNSDVVVSKRTLTDQEVFENE